jgi:quercetin dioxygenase-like cupin family protein
MRSIHSLAVVVALPLQVALAQTHKSPALNWGPAPPVFPTGARMAVLQGDPSKSELFTVRLSFPNGYQIAPHYHPTDEHITVIQGTLLVGMGDTVSVSRAMRFATGAFGTAPANQHHYAIARGRTIVQVHAMGPFMLTYVNPADDLSQKPKAATR